MEKGVGDAVAELRANRSGAGYPNDVVTSGVVRRSRIRQFSGSTIRTGQPGRAIRRRSGFSGTWITDTGLTQSLAVKSSGVIGRPAVPTGNGGNYVRFASPINLSTSQLFVAYDITNLGGAKLAATRIDLNFSTTAPFVNYRAFFGGMDPTTGHFDFEMESGVCTGCVATAIDTKIPDNDSAKHRVVLRRWQPWQRGLFCWCGCDSISK